MSALDLERVAWPAEALGDALFALAERAGLQPHHDARRREEVPRGDEGLAVLALASGLEVVRVQASWRRALDLMARGPALLPLPDGRVLALLRARAGHAQLLAPDLGVVHTSAAALRTAASSAPIAKVTRDIATELERLGIPPRRRAKAGELLLDARLGALPAFSAWLVQPASSRPLMTQLRELGFFAALSRLGLVVVLNYALVALGWLFLGWGALSGRVDPGWLLAWVLALATQVPLRAAFVALTGRVALLGGAAIKRLLLVGALSGDIDGMRARGVGGLIGRAIESEAFEALALNGAVRLLIGAFELIVALTIAGAGAGGGALVALALVVLALTLVGGWRYLAKKDAWTRARLDLTGDLIERMVGHRTRLAQEAPADWHRGEDQALAGYLQRASAPDRLESLLGSVPRRGFMLLGLVLVAFAAGTRPEPLPLALALAGVLLASQALDSLANGTVAVAGALVARRVVQDLVLAARRPERIGALLPGRAAPPADGDTRTVMELSRVGFTYPGRARAVLDDVSLTLRQGDRLLLEGGSGSGKSTLAALFAGLRQPTRGLILLAGLDPATWGERAWRKRAVAAPQFHENRVIAGTFAFNLLLGRGGMPEPKALAEAEALCHELGLGPLLERMPAGLMQQVGESGWQLSHGEKSRVYLARALLQDAELVVLDESFGPLDPENQGKALACAMRHCKTLCVIAHP